MGETITVSWWILLVSHLVVGVIGAVIALWIHDYQERDEDEDYYYDEE